MEANFKVLVVDDDEHLLYGFIMDYLNETLGKNGYELSTATSGVEALEKIAQNKPKTIILDTELSLYMMDGFQFFEIIRENPNLDDVKVIAMCDDPSNIQIWNRIYGKTSSNSRYRERGIDAVIEKSELIKLSGLVEQLNQSQQ